MLFRAPAASEKRRIQRLGPIRVGTGDGAARAFVFPDTFSFRRRELKVRSIATLPNPVGVNERPERGMGRRPTTRRQSLQWFGQPTLIERSAPTEMRRFLPFAERWPFGSGRIHQRP
jgi:hypothetical protein